MPSTRRAEAADAVEPGAAAGATRVLKKYPNRRLYDTRTSSYITLADVKRMVLEGQTFEVRDAKTGEDLTRTILLQIILEEESGGVPMFSTPMLSQIIRFYGHAMQGMMGAWLEKNLQTFVEMQNRFVGQAGNPFEAAKLGPEAWAQMFGAGNPFMQNLMGSYLEQSQSLMEKMQEQMKDPAKLFPLMPGFPPTKR